MSDTYLFFRKSNETLRATISLFAITRRSFLPKLWSARIGVVCMSMLSFGERRGNPRQRLGRLATIKLGVGIEPRYVLVSNVSTEGVRLQLDGIEPVDEFVLLFSRQRLC